MTDDSNDTLVDIPESLEEFEEVFHEKPSDDLVDTEDNALATDEDKDAPAETGDEDEAPEEAEAKEPKKKSFQKRINEITREKHEAERRAMAREAELLRRLETLEARESKEVRQEPLQQRLPQGAPTPDSTDANGDPLYPLGQFDPEFISDLTKFTIKHETDVQKAAERQEAAQREQQELDKQIAIAETALKDAWAEKLDEAEAEKPEIRENIAELAGAFAGIDPAYGEYLAITVMGSESGPEILDYLSQNIGEAQKIVASGPAAATLHLGRLDAYFASQKTKGAPQEAKSNSKRVSDAPEPPETTARGRKGQVSVKPDTTDLKAFEREFYKK